MLFRLLLAIAVMVAPTKSAWAAAQSREKDLLSAMALQNADQNVWFHKLAGSFENDATRIQEALSRQKQEPEPPAKKLPPTPAFSMPVVLLFIAATLVFTPSVFRVIADTLYNDPGVVSGTEGLDVLHTKLPQLSSPELRLVAGVLVSRILKDDPSPPVLAGLKDIMAFLATYRPDAAVEPVLEGALAGIRDQNHHLNIDEKATVLAAITRWVTGSYDERQLKPAAIGAAIGAFVQHAIGQLDEAGFTRDEQAALAGEIVKGAVWGLGDAGLATAAEIASLRGVVKNSVVALASNDVYPDAVGPALDGILKGALTAAVAPQYPTRQQRQAMANVILGVSDGMDVLATMKPRSLAFKADTRPKLSGEPSSDELIVHAMIDRHGTIEAAVRTQRERIGKMADLARDAATRGEDVGHLRELSAEAIVDYQRLKSALEKQARLPEARPELVKANSALPPLDEVLKKLAVALQRP